MGEQGSIYETVSGLADARPFPERLKQLVHTFHQDVDAYRAKSYKEMALRTDFLNPLLEELGWDPLNTKGSVYSDREVIQEDEVTIDGKQKAPDYAVLVGGKRRFFVEAKRPSVNIESDRAPAYQLRRYCWTANLPFGLVTDFEEFAIYDCRRPPELTDSALVGRVAYFQLDQLEDNWPLLDSMFGRANVQAGILDLLASEVGAPAGTRPIDVAFLEEIRGWRRAFASEIAASDAALSTQDVNAAVQTLIDRVVFLRVAEARGLEVEGSLRHAATAESGVYSALLTLFRKADDRYNSGLFHLNGDPDDPDVDVVGPNLHLSNELLASVINRLYYPEPYEFSVMPADILGRIYEQFLGERIVLDVDRKVAVELKPEFRKSGGVYYTPTTIVNYIVEETLGPLLKGKDPADLRREGFAVVDPASGSGSFLIAAYQYLLDWHRDRYAAGTRLAGTYLETGLDGQVRVKTRERKRILTDYIFGVDIDPQAVEVTKLSLLLKVIDGQAQLEFDIGRILPDLGANIACGNSLIDEDFVVPLQATSEEMALYNPFSWASAFPQVFKRGGFDAVIGNPPYLNIDATWGRKDPRLAYLRAAYSEVYADKTDLLFYFLKKAAEISRGESAFIVSRSFLEADKARRLRGWLASHVRIRSVLDFRHARVFPRVGINTAIVRMTHSTAAKKSTFLRFVHQSLRPGYDSSYLRDAVNLTQVTVNTGDLGSRAWNFGDASVEEVLKKIDSAGVAVGDILHIGEGMQTGANKSFVITPAPLRRQQLRDLGFLYERARNSDIQQYYIAHSGVQLLYVEGVANFEKLPFDVRSRLSEEESVLKSRAAYVRGNCDWWRFTWPLHKDYFDRPRLLVPYRASRNRFALDEHREFLGLTDTTVLYDNGQGEDIRYILGLLNTRILTARFRFIGKLLGGGVFEYYENTVSKLPIVRGCPGEPAHDRVVELVKAIEHATRDLRTTQLADERAEAQAILDTAREEIEDIAGRLYGLSALDREVLDSQLNE